MQFASVVGVYGLGFLTILLCLTPTLLGDQNWSWGSSIPFLVVLLGFSVIWVFGSKRLTDASPSVVEGVNLRIVQANIPQNLKWKPAYKLKHINSHIKLSSLQSKNGFIPTHII